MGSMANSAALVDQAPEVYHRLTVRQRTIANKKYARILRGDPGRNGRGLDKAAQNALYAANTVWLTSFTLFGMAGASLIGLGQSRWWPAIPVGVVLVVAWLVRSALGLRFAIQIQRYFRAKQMDPVADPDL
jgi:hypothetical protein